MANYGENTNGSQFFILTCWDSRDRLEFRGILTCRAGTPGTGQTPGTFSPAVPGTSGTGKSPGKLSPAGTPGTDQSSGIFSPAGTPGTGQSSGTFSPAVTGVEA
jgi:hypothetical protein